MASKVTFKNFTSIENLKLSWNRLMLSSDGLYKNYFRENYRTYSLSLDKNLQRLSRDLQKDTWEPTIPSYVYFPKKSGLLRKYSLLTVEDQIVYQALANVIAFRAEPRLSKYYNRKTFSHQLNSKKHGAFFSDYRMGYGRFNSAIVRAYSRGKHFIADFDLTSFYDSIDHHMLRQSLDSMRIPPDLTDFLNRALKKWTEAQVKSTVYSQGHGIPQGPMSSAFFAEVILHRFDRLFEKESKTTYLRYVDDIRIMASNELEVRRELIRLDFVSKMLGLFPQSLKVNVRRVTDIKSEIKSASDILIFDPDDPVEQIDLQENIKLLTPRLTITDESKLKYALGQCKPSPKMNGRVVNLLTRHVHLYQIFINFLTKTKHLSKSQSKTLLDFIRRDDLYYSVVAQIVDLLRLHGHRSIRAPLAKFCKSRQQGKGKNYSELIYSLSAYRLEQGNMTWAEFCRVTSRTKDWWSLSKLMGHINSPTFGSPTVDSFLFKMMKESNGEISLSAADKFIAENFSLGNRQRTTLSLKPQILLKDFAKISRVRTKHCYLRRCLDEIIMEASTTFNWKGFMANHYQKSLGLMQRWKAYRRTDPTAWINMTDVLMDLFLDRLYAAEPSMGVYMLGNVGGVLGAPTGKLAKSFPKFYAAAEKVHSLRLESDLTHAQIRRTRRYTRFITHREAKYVVRLLRSAFFELNAKGHLT